MNTSSQFRPNPDYRTNSPSQDELKAFINQCSTLVEHSERLLLRSQIWLAWFSSPPNDRSRGQNWVFWLTGLLALPIWLYLAVVNLFASAVVVISAIPAVSAVSTSQAESQYRAIFTGIYIVLTIAFFMLAYLRWGIFLLKDKRYSRLIRWMSAALAVGISMWFVWQLERWLLPYRAPLWYWIFTIIILVFPGITYFLLAVMVTIGGLITYTWNLIYRQLPMQKDVILRLLSEPIPYNHYAGSTEESQQNEWMLCALDDKTFRVLNKWVKTNQENSEKRLVPMALLLAALGVMVDTFAPTGIFTTLLERLFRWTFSAFLNFNVSANSIAFFALFMVGVLIVVLIVKTFQLLFRNLVVQGLVLEAFALAEFWRVEQQQTAPAPQNGNNSLPRHGYLKRIWMSLWSAE